MSSDPWQINNTQDPFLVTSHKAKSKVLQKEKGQGGCFKYAGCRTGLLFWTLRYFKIPEAIKLNLYLPLFRDILEEKDYVSFFSNILDEKMKNRPHLHKRSNLDAIGLLYKKRMRELQSMNRFLILSIARNVVTQLLHYVPFSHKTSV